MVRMHIVLYCGEETEGLSASYESKMDRMRIVLWDVLHIQRAETSAVYLHMTFCSLFIWYLLHSLIWQ